MDDINQIIPGQQQQATTGGSFSKLNTAKLIITSEYMATRREYRFHTLEMHRPLKCNVETIALSHANALNVALDKYESLRVDDLLFVDLDYWYWKQQQKEVNEKATTLILTFEAKTPINEFCQFRLFGEEKRAIVVIDD